MSQTQDTSPAAADRGNTAGYTADISGSMQYTAPSVGERLRSAREASGWAIAEVALKLKLSPDQIAALESDELSRMHCNAIARGFIRNYARLLGLDAAELMDALDQSLTSRQNAIAVPGGMNVPVPDGELAHSRNYFWIVASFLLLFAVVATYLFLPSDFVQTILSSKEKFGETTVRAKTSENRTASEVASPSTSATPGASAGAISAPVIIAPGTTVPSVASTAVDNSITSVSARAAEDSADAEDNVLKFSFSQSSWVEVKDRNGKVIFSRLNPPDSQREVKGQPPFALLIGNASNVSLVYRGKPVDLSKRSKDDVARVTLE